MGQAQAQFVLLDAEMSQQFVHAVDPALQVVPHLQQLILALSEGLQKCVGAMDFLHNQGRHPRLFEEPVHQPFIQRREHHVVVRKTCQDHLDHFGVGFFGLPNQVDARHGGHALVRDHHINPLLIQGFHRFVGALRQTDIEVPSERRIECSEVACLVIHEQDHGAFSRAHDLSNPKRKASMLALSFANWFATSMSLLEEGLSCNSRTSTSVMLPCASM